MTDEPKTPTIENAVAIARSQKSYLLRAMHEWLSDHDHTPHLLVNLKHPQLQVPPHLRTGETVVLNISMGATSHLVIGNEVITFGARFKQKSFPLSVPIGAVAAIFSKETQVGMMFEVFEDAPTAAAPDALVKDSSVPTKRAKPSFLTIVK